MVIKTETEVTKEPQIELWPVYPVEAQALDELHELLSEHWTTGALRYQGDYCILGGINSITRRKKFVGQGLNKKLKSIIAKAIAGSGKIYDAGNALSDDSTIIHFNDSTPRHMKYIDPARWERGHKRVLNAIQKAKKAVLREYEERA